MEGIVYSQAVNHEFSVSEVTKHLSEVKSQSNSLK